MKVKKNAKKVVEDHVDLPVNNEGWWHILAYNPDIKLEHTFWLWAETKDELDNLLISKGIDDVKWTRRKVPPFIPKNIKRV